MIAIREEFSDDGTLVCTLVGELDADNAPGLVDQLRKSHRCTSDLVLVVEQLAFIDSSGIRALLQLREMAVAGGGTFELVGPTPNVLRVLEITGLLELFDLS